MAPFCSFLFALLAIILCVKSNLQCIDNSGKVVDWWYAYKSNDGTKYSYFDGSSTASKLTPGTQTLTAGSNSCVERTLNQVWNNKKGVNYVSYNDENPNGTTSSKMGHVKGVLSFDDASAFSGGFWLIQAVPKFPNLGAAKYVFASNGEKYGQNFLCVSIGSLSIINRASGQLRYMQPYVNFYNNLNPTSTAINNFTSVGKASWSQGTSIAAITSKGGKAFTHFTRSGSESKDIMESVISPHYKFGFEWSTWPNEASFEPSYCKPKYAYNEENIKSITLGNGVSITNTNDHSKYAISIATDSKNIVCSGDLNRATTQNPRGGGYMCFSQPSLWNAINNVVTSVDKC